MLRHKRKPIARFAAVLLAAVTMAGLAAGCGNKASAKVVAEYDGGTITEAEYKAYEMLMNFGPVQDAESQQYLIKRLVMERVLSSRATEEARQAGTEEADLTYEQIKTTIDSQEDLKKQLKDAGLTDELLQRFIRDTTIMVRDAEMKVSDADIQTRYDENKEKGLYEYASVRHILIGFTDKNQQERTEDEALKLAREVKKKLEDGGDWTALASEYSDDPGSASDGGLYEKVYPETWVEEFKNAARTFPIGQIGEPVKTSYGYHVMKVEDRGTKTLDDVKEELRQTMFSESLNQFLQEEVDKLITKTDLPALPTSSPTDGEGEDEATPEESPAAS